MLGDRVFIVLRSVIVPVVAGWAALIALTYVERPLLLWTAPLVGAHWLATAKVSFDCLALAATGWVIGRLNRSAPLPGVFVFAATLALFNLDGSLGIDIPTLIRLAAGAFRDAGYRAALTTTAIQHLFLFGSLIVGGLLSRRPRAPLSLFGEPH